MSKGLQGEGNGEMDFSASLEPVVGNWYCSKDGDLIRLRLAAYQRENLSALLLEYMDGHRAIVSIADWYDMQLHRDMLTVSQQHTSS